MNKLWMALAAGVMLSACSPQQEGQNASGAEQTSVSGSRTGLFHGSDLRAEQLGGDFTLTDGAGEPFSLSSLKGKAVILSFGFTNCPDVCPTELLSYSDALKQLGEQAKDVAVVFVSVDPERDTPDLIGRYVKQFNPEFIGLTDTQGGRELALAKQLYRVVSAKTEIKSDTLYNVDHTSGAYLLDKQGDAAVFLPYGMDAAHIAEDVKTLLAQ